MSARVWSLLWCCRASCMRRVVCADGVPASSCGALWSVDWRAQGTVASCVTPGSTTAATASRLGLAAWFGRSRGK